MSLVLKPNDKMFRIRIKNPGIYLPIYHKTMLIMRLTIVLLVASLMQVSAASYAQRISLSTTKVPLKSVLSSLSQQTGYDFVYTEQLLKTAGPVTIRVKNAELPEVLEQIFRSQPLSYALDSRTVILKVKEKSYLERIVEKFQEIDVNGRVLDEGGSPIPGATIKVKGKSQTKVSGLNGEFSLINLTESDVIQISLRRIQKWLVHG